MTKDVLIDLIKGLQESQEIEETSRSSKSKPEKCGGDSGDPLSSDEEEDKEESRPEDLLGLKMAEKQFVKAPITVFWDVGSCGIPEDCDDRYASMVVNNIRLALKKMNYHGVISFFGYGDCNLTPRKVNNSICRSGITYLHVDGNGESLKLC
ncbi:hypothetical protein F2Q70_00020397 [Brassica cretica]|uniref:NYN domain-containing protein n=1 Tax=Brassica cretica TaxID=69181 RepID=A0A8S9GY25_BRACR|nr:hypothetical protein F2Q70_00020397 [Brassica cretica]